MEIFQKSVIKKYLQTLDESQVKPAYKKFLKFYGNKARVQNITLLKEENYQEGFLREIFVQVLGYTINPDENYNLTTEFKNLIDAKKADAAILKDGKAIAVIELKSTQTKNLESIKQQAFNYKNNQPDCKYVITSNFQFLRFYIDNATEFEEFDLFRLTEAEFSKLYLILSKDSIFSDLPARLKQETQFHEQKISDTFYNDYSIFKRKIFNNLVANNPQHDKLLLFKKSQKLLDRLLFVFFAEDRGLVPPNAIARIIDQWNQLKELEAYQPLYDRFKLLFNHLDTGHTYKNYELPGYDGGLFEPDELLDSVIIDDEILYQDSLKLSSYDFDTEIDVNILGHIFEHSLNEIEEITAELEGTPIDRKKTKRKKEGIFYTPKYITQYIVENTIGALCQEKKTELGIADVGIDESHCKADGKISQKGKQLFQQLNHYKDWLLSLKILDPACGSGAFLNQALDFLINEHKTNDALINELTDHPLGLFDTDKAILENNLYGVDINEESVEIARLSLWLRTAKKGRKLSMLNNNIKCGNSLIDDPAVAGDKAFDWHKEFPDIMAKGGFDVVIGNPPYGASLSDLEKNYYLKISKTFQGNFDIYFFFIENCSSLVKQSGKLGFITPDTWIKVPQAQKLRNYILEKYGINEIITFEHSVFRDASVNSIIFILTSQQFNSKCKVTNIDKDYQIISLYSSKYSYFCTINNWKKTIDKQFQIFQTDDLQSLLNKLKIESYKGEELLDVSQGIVPYSKENLTEEEIKTRIYHSSQKIDSTYGIWVQGRTINRYSINLQNHEYLKYGIWLHRPRKHKYFKNERILIQEITGGYPSRISATIYDDILYHDPGIISCLNISSYKIKYILAILNSKLISWYHVIYSPKGKRTTFPKVLIGDIRNFPIKKTSQHIQNQFVEKVDQMLSLNKKLQVNKKSFLNRLESNFDFDKISKKVDSFYEFDFKTFLSELKKNKIQISLIKQDEWEDYFNDYKQKIIDLKRQIDQTDREIDQMVYELYGLTPEEIEIVEKSM